MIKSIKKNILKVLNNIQILWIKTKGNIIWLKNAKIYGKPIITVKKNSTIEIGENFVSISKAKYNVIWVYSKTVIRTLSSKAKIKIWKDVGVSWASIVAHKSITIGDWVLIWANVTIIDSDFHPIKSNNRRYAEVTEKDCKSIIIEDNVFIWMNSIILKGSYIKRNTVVWANSVVTGEIEENSIIVGNPAKLIKKIV